MTVLLIALAHSIPIFLAAGIFKSRGAIWIATVLTVCVAIGLGASRYVFVDLVFVLGAAWLLLGRDWSLDIKDSHAPLDGARKSRQPPAPANDLKTAKPDDNSSSGWWTVICVVFGVGYAMLTREAPPSQTPPISQPLLTQASQPAATQGAKPASSAPQPKVVSRPSPLPASQPPLPFSAKDETCLKLKGSDEMVRCLEATGAVQVHR